MVDFQLRKWNSIRPAHMYHHRKSSDIWGEWIKMRVPRARVIYLSRSQKRRNFDHWQTFQRISLKGQLMLVKEITSRGRRFQYMRIDNSASLCKDICSWDTMCKCKYVYNKMSTFSPKIYIFIYIYCMYICKLMVLSLSHILCFTCISLCVITVMFVVVQLFIAKKRGE